MDITATNQRRYSSLEYHRQAQITFNVQIVFFEIFVDEISSSGWNFNILFKFGGYYTIFHLKKSSGGPTNIVRDSGATEHLKMQLFHGIWQFRAIIGHLSGDMFDKKSENFFLGGFCT